MKKYFIRKAMISAIAVTMLVGGFATSASAVKPVKDLETEIQKIDFEKTSFEDVLKLLVGDEASKINKKHKEELKEIYDWFFDEEDVDEKQEIKEEFADELEGIIGSDKDENSHMRIMYSRVGELNNKLDEFIEKDANIVNRNDYKRAKEYINQIDELFKGKEYLELSVEKREELEDKLDELEDLAYESINILDDGREVELEYFKDLMEYMVSQNEFIKKDKSYENAEKIYNKLELMIKDNGDLTDKENKEYEQLVEKFRSNISSLEKYTEVQNYLESIEDEIDDLDEEVKKDSDYKKIKNCYSKIKKIAKREALGKLSESDKEQFGELKDILEELIEDLRDKY